MAKLRYGWVTTFLETIERVNSRLAGWKSRCLSLAGRITLTKSVVCAIPIHIMSTIKLPASTLALLIGLLGILCGGALMFNGRCISYRWIRSVALRRRVVWASDALRRLSSSTEGL